MTESEPESLIALIDRAEAYAGAGKMDAAIDAYQHWLDSGELPGAYAAYFNLAVLYFKADRKGLAQAALRACLRCNPGFETAKGLCVEPTMDQRRPMAARANYGHARLKIGWLGHVSAFQRTAVKEAFAGLSASVAEHLVFAWGPEVPVDAVDVSATLDEFAAAKIRALEIDVLVDLMAWENHSRPGIVAYHPAPLVAAWPSQPQPSGLRAVDAILTADAALQSQAESQFQETVLRYDAAVYRSEVPPSGLLAQIEVVLQQCLQQLPMRAQNPTPSSAELQYLVAPSARGRRYVIVAPPFQHASAGIRVLYDLQKWLILAGFDAMVCTWFTGYPVESFAEDIVVYPEVAPGNVLKAKRVVRFILNSPGKLGHGEKTYAPNELLVAYNSELSSFADGFVLQVPSTEPYFCPSDGPREMDAVYVGKGRNLGLHPASCVEITRNFPPTRPQLAELLRSVKTLYSYDDFTMLAHEAKICGCNVTLINAMGTMEPLQTSPVPSLEVFRAQLHHFIKITQNL